MESLRHCFYLCCQRFVFLGLKQTKRNRASERPARVNTGMACSPFAREGRSTGYVPSFTTLKRLTRFRSAACSRKPPDALFITVLMAFDTSCLTYPISPLKRNINGHPEQVVVGNEPCGLELIGRRPAPCDGTSHCCYFCPPTFRCVQQNCSSTRTYVLISAHTSCSTQHFMHSVSA